MEGALPLVKLIEQFAKLPGVGRKTAQRFAFYILDLPEEKARDFAGAILDARTKIKKCPVCGNLTDGELCPICAAKGREKGLICVVEDPRDVLAFERTKEYNGVYHVLHGLISPMDGVGHRHVHRPAAKAPWGKGDAAGLRHPGWRQPGVRRRGDAVPRPGRAQRAVVRPPWGPWIS